MTTAISPLPMQRFTDNNGNPLSGGKLFVYAAGTTTKTTTYTDSTGGTPNTNPVILNTRGEASVWLAAGANVKFVLSPSTDTDPPTSPIWTVDNIPPADGISAAMLPFVQASSTTAALSDIDYLSPLSGAAARTVQSRFNDFISVKDFGATGNGSIDDTAAIQAALDAIVSTGGTLYFPPGKYLVSGSGLSLNQSALSDGVALTRVNLLGAGMGSTEIYYTGTNAALTYTGASAEPGIQAYAQIEKLRFQGTSTTTSGLTGLAISYGSQIAVRDCLMEDFYYGLSLSNCFSMEFENCLMLGNSIGVYAVAAGTTAPNNPNALTFINCEVSNNADGGVFFYDCATVQFIGGAIEQNGQTGSATTRYGASIYQAAGGAISGVGGAWGASFLGVYFENNANSGDILFTAGTSAGQTGLLCSGCTFNRVGTTSTDWSTNNISVTIGGANLAVVTVVGCGFSGYGGYTVSSGRPYIAWNSTTNLSLRLSGNNYGSATESPDYADTLIDTSSNAKVLIEGYGSGQGTGLTFAPADDTNETAIAFNNAAHTLVGQIYTSSTATTYATTSDHRIKTDVEPMAGALARLQQLQAKRFRWTAEPSGEKVDGFLAHEVQAVIPHAVKGAKDAVDAEGKPVLQMMDYGKLVPLLWGAVAELAAEVAALKAKP